MIEIIQVQTEDEIEAARLIFREYEKWLGLDLCFQGFEAELASLPGRYEPPDGRLYLAYSGGRLAGCIALRDLGEGICEMKRLFVRDEFRGQKIGIALIETIIEDACATGYQAIRLDTYPPKMGKAVSLYETHGFRPIEPYYDNPNDGVLYMELSF